MKNLMLAALITLLSLPVFAQTNYSIDYQWREVQQWQEFLGPRYAFASCYDETIGSGAVLITNGYKNPWHFYYESPWTHLNGHWWEASFNHPTERQFAEMAFMKSQQRAILFGGVYEAPWGRQFLGDTLAFDFASGFWYDAVYDGPDAREGHKMVYNDASGTIFLFGGRNEKTFFNDLWEFDGQQWKPITVSFRAPQPRAHHAMVYDQSRNVIFLHGGINEAGRVLDDTWEFDGATWTQVKSHSGPGPRSGHDLAYDPERQQVVLFGGNGGTYADIWIYGLRGWRQARVAPSFSAFRFYHLYPESRIFSMIEYDPNVRGFVIFGGWNRTSGALADTWYLGAP